MIPVFFKIGSFEVRSYGVLLLIGFFVALLIARKRAPRFGFTAEQISDLSVWTLLTGVLGARLLFILQELPYYLENTDQLFSLHFEGLTSFGGLIGGFLFLLFWCRKKGYSTLSLFDLIAPGVLIALGIGRIGCLLNGCCYGGVCDPSLPWAIPVHGSSSLHHPAQAYDAIMNFIGAGIIFALERRGLAKGQGTALFLVMYGLARFIYEFWRAGTTSEILTPIPITLAQVTAIAMVVAGLAFYFWYGRASTPREAAAG